MKRLVIDLSSVQPVNGTQSSGGGLYAEKMFYTLHNRYGSDVLWCLLDSRRGKCERVLEYIRENNIETYIYSDENQLSEFIDSHCDELFYLPICFPEFHTVSLKTNPLIIATIHDLSSIYELNCKLTKEKLVDHSLLKELLKYSLLHSFVLNRHIDRHNKISNLSAKQIILTDSDYSKEQMLKYLKISNSTNIHVFYPLLFGKKDASDNKLSIDCDVSNKEFLFFVSANRWHKNNFFAVSAIDEEISKGNQYLKSLKYVVTGLNDESMSFYSKRIRNKDNFILKGYISKEEYDYMMRNALCMVYPSLFEGFGAPPIEAMSYGTPPLCSSATCIPEISGDAAIYFNPYDKSDFINAVMKTKDKKLMNELAIKGKERFIQIVNRQDEDLEKALELFDANM